MKWPIIIVFLASQVSYSQSIEGIVRDAETNEVVLYANVYLAETLQGTSTDIDGAFEFKNLKSGTYDVVVSHIGYQDLVQIVNVEFKKRISLQLSLMLKSNVLSEVFVNADTTGWKHNYHLFKTFFLGTTLHSSEVEIKNPEVLSFFYDPLDNMFFAHAKKVLVIENYALGYRIFYKLKQFEMDMESGILFSFGIPRFDQIAPSRKSQTRKWEKSREKSRNGSFEHFLTALKDDKLTEEGFYVQKIIRIKNSGRPPQEEIDEKLFFFRKRLKAQLKKGEIKLNVTSLPEFDSLQYWTKWDHSKTYIDSLGSVILHREELMGSLNTLRFQGILKVIYLNEKEELSYRKGNVRDNKQTSLVHFLNEGMLLYENGNYDNESILFEQYLGWHAKLAEMLPLDYEPTKK